MSYIVQHTTGNIIQVIGEYKAIGYSPVCDDCGARNGFYSEKINYEGTRKRGWVCMDCGIIIKWMDE